MCVYLCEIHERNLLRMIRRIEIQSGNQRNIRTKVRGTMTADLMEREKQTHFFKLEALNEDAKDIQIGIQMKQIEEQR